MERWKACLWELWGSRSRFEFRISTWFRRCCKRYCMYDAHTININSILRAHNDGKIDTARDGRAPTPLNLPHYRATLTANSLSARHLNAGLHPRCGTASDRLCAAIPR